MKIIYIVGTSHSGSTLLDMMLNAHPKIISVGEVLKLNQVKLSDGGDPKPTHCSCGARGLPQCEFWSTVNEYVEKSYGKSLWGLSVNNDNYSDAKLDPNVLLFKAIAAVSGKAFIVDSSKTPRRLKHLMELSELNVRPIYLSRDPRGQIASVIARNGLMRSIVHHEVVHAQIRLALKSVPHDTVRYEDLVIEPERILGRLMTSLGLEFNDRQLQWAEQVKHSFAGNHVRLRNKSKLALDDKWRDVLNPSQQLLIQLGTTLSRRAQRVL